MMLDHSYIGADLQDDYTDTKSKINSNYSRKVGKAKKGKKGKMISANPLSQIQEEKSEQQPTPVAFTSFNI